MAPAKTGLVEGAASIAIGSTRQTGSRHLHAARPGRFLTFWKGIARAS